MRAGAGCKISAPGQKLHGSVVYFFIPSLRTLDGLSALGERRRVKDYEIKRLFALRFKLGEQIENISNNEIKLFFKPIQPRIGSCCFNCGFGNINRSNLFRSAESGVERKRACVGEAIENPLALCDF